MSEGIGFAVAALFIIGFSYAFLRQIQQTGRMQKASKTLQQKRALVASYVTSLAFAGFLISFALNIAIGTQWIEPGALSSNGTGISCFLFLAVLFIAKFGMAPKKAVKAGLPN